MASLKDLIVHGTSKFISNVFGNIIHANKFVKNGGTSSQFLKADGSVDSNTYATTAFVQSATNGMAIDTNVVHKTGNETIAGVKTFTDNVILEDAPTQGSHAANKEYVDNADNSVFLNGATASYKIYPYSLCAFAIWNGGTWMAMTSFTDVGGTGSKTALSEVKFPIGCKIYYHPDSEEAPAVTSFYHKKFYTSYKSVDARYSAITGSNVSLGTQNWTSVYLMVSVDGYYWSPYYKEGSSEEIIVSPDNFKSGNYYIYLGKKSTLTINGYEFQLEDNNILYYFNGDDLIDWATHLKTVIEWQSTQDMTTKADKVEEATNGNLAGLDYSGNLTDSGIAADEVATLGTNQLTNYYKKTETYSKSETDELIRAASDFEYVEVSTLPTASANTKGKFYLYNGHRYVTTESAGGVFSWVDLGSYDIDLSGYVTNTTFEEAIRVRPAHQEVTEAQLRSMLDNETWEENVIYYTVEEE